MGANTWLQLTFLNGQRSDKYPDAKKRNINDCVMQDWFGLFLQVAAINKFDVIYLSSDFSPK